jgi:hypothetical protein
MTHFTEQLRDFDQFCQDNTYYPQHDDLHCNN